MSDIFAEPEKKPFNERFVNLLAETGREGMQGLIEWLVDETDFFTAPASTRFHGAVEGGLVDHSLAVYDSLLKIADEVFAEYKLETIAIVALLHDVCKANFYKVDYKNAKDPIIDGKQMPGWHKIPYYTIDDQYPYGHGEKSVDILRDFIELTKEERMAIRWHMGLTDTDYATRQSLNGAFSKYPLAAALHMADMTANYFDGK